MNCTYKLITNNDILFFKGEEALNKYIADNIKSYVNTKGDVVYSISDHPDLSSLDSLAFESEEQKEALIKVFNISKPSSEASGKAGVTSVVNKHILNKTEYNLLSRIKSLREQKDEADVPFTIAREIFAKHTGNIAHKSLEVAMDIIAKKQLGGENLIIENGVVSRKNFDEESYAFLRNSVVIAIQKANEDIRKEKRQFEKDLSAAPIPTEEGKRIYDEVREYFSHTIDFNDTSLVDSITDNAVNLVTSILKDHVKDGKITSIILTENKVYSKNLVSRFAKGEWHHLAVTGITDVLFIKDDGSIQVLDYKTALKPYNEWSIEKKTDVYAQQRLYKELFEQAGINATDISLTIFPLNVNFQFNTVEEGDTKINLVTAISYTTYAKNSIVNLDQVDIPNKYGIDSKIRTHFRKDYTSPEVSGLSFVKNNFIKKFFPQSFNPKRNEEKRASRKFKDKAVDLGDGMYEFIDDTGKTPETITGTKEDIEKYILTNIIRKKGVRASTQNKIFIDRFIEADEKHYSELKNFFVSEHLEDRRHRLEAHILEPYKHSGRYTRLKHPDLEELGILIFRDETTSTPESTNIEIVTVSGKDLNDIIPLVNGNNLLGNVKSKKTLTLDGKKHLQSSSANIEALSALHAILQKEDLIDPEKGGYKISKMLVANVADGQYSYIPVKQLSEDYHQMQNGIQGDNTEIKPKNVEYINNNRLEEVSKILDYYKQEGIYSEKFKRTTYEGLKKKIEKIQSAEKNYTDNKEYLLYAIDTLRKFLGDPNPSTGKILNSEDPSIVLELSDIYLSSVLSYEEEFVSDIKTSIGLSGIESGYIDSPSNMRNSTVSFMHKLTTLAVQKIQDKYTKKLATVRSYQHEWFKALEENEGSYGNTKRQILGNEVGLYDRFYEPDPDNPSKKNKALRLKKYNDPTLKPYDQKYLYSFLKEIYINRKLAEDKNFVFTSEQKELFEKELERYPSSLYLIPLTRKDNKRISSIKDNTVNKVKGLVEKGVKKTWEEFSLLDLEANQLDYASTDEAERIKQSYDSNVAYNRFEHSHKSTARREELLSEKGPEFYETNLNTIVLQHSFEYIKEEEFAQLLPKVTALKDVVAFKAGAKNLTSEKTMEYIENYIKEHIFNLSVFDNPSTRKFNAALKGLKNITSKLMLSFNLVNTTRDITEGLVRNLGEALLKVGLKKISPQNISKAYAILTKHGVDKITGISLTQALNERSGFSNMDLMQMVSRTKSERTGLQSLFSRWSGSTASGGDYLNRMVVLVGYMLEQGVFDSLSVDAISGKIEYDITKDNRFSKLFDGTDSKSPEYLEQLALLKLRIEEHNKEYPEKPLKVEHILRRMTTLDFPYSNAELLSIRHVSDMNFGFFNSIERMAINNNLLGSLFVHFGTYLSAAKDRYFMPSSINNTQRSLHHVTNEQGEKLYKHVIPGSEDTPSSAQYIINTDPTGEPILEYRGDFMEGMLVTFNALIKDIYITSRQEGFAKAFSSSRLKEEFFFDPIRKNNLAKLLRDLLSFIVFGYLGTLLNDVIDDDSTDSSVKPLLYITANGAINANQGLFFIFDIYSRITNPNIPSFTYLNRVVTSPKFLFRKDPDYGKFLSVYMNGFSPFLQENKKIYTIGF